MDVNPTGFCFQPFHNFLTQYLHSNDKHAVSQATVFL